MKRENQFQSELIKEIQDMMPDSMILKIDPTSSHRQGIPDLLILNGPSWAMLEVKRDARASHQPNQDYYVSLLNDWSYSSFVYPENKDEVLDELKQVFRI